MCVRACECVWIVCVCLWVRSCTCTFVCARADRACWRPRLSPCVCVCRGVQVGDCESVPGGEAATEDVIVALRRGRASEIRYIRSQPREARIRRPVKSAGVFFPVNSLMIWWMKGWISQLVGRWWLLWTFQKVIFQLQLGTAAALHSTCTAPSYSFFKYSWFQDSSSGFSLSSANSVTNIISNSSVIPQYPIWKYRFNRFQLEDYHKKNTYCQHFVLESYSWTTTQNIWIAELCEGIKLCCKN